MFTITLDYDAERYIRQFQPLVISRQCCIGQCTVRTHGGELYVSNGFAIGGRDNDGQWVYNKENGSLSFTSFDILPSYFMAALVIQCDKHWQVLATSTDGQHDDENLEYRARAHSINKIDPDSYRWENGQLSTQWAKIGNRCDLEVTLTGERLMAFCQANNIPCRKNMHGRYYKVYMTNRVMYNIRNGNKYSHGDTLFGEKPE